MKKLNLLLLLFMFGLVGTMSGQNTFFWSIHPDAGGASLKVVVTDRLTGLKSVPVDMKLNQGEEVASGTFEVPPFSLVEYYSEITGGRLQTAATEQGMWVDYYQESIFSPNFSLYDEGFSTEYNTFDLSIINSWDGNLNCDACIHLFAY